MTTVADRLASTTDLGARARQLLRREGFVKGCQHACLFPEQRTTEQFKQAARDAFPLPTIRRPLRVTMSNGDVWSYGVYTRLVYRHDDTCSYTWWVDEALKHLSETQPDRAKLADDLRLFARILSGEMEDVPDDGSGVAVADGDDNG